MKVELEELSEAVERVIACRTARVTFTRLDRFDQAPTVLSRRRGGLLRAAGERLGRIAQSEPIVLHGLIDFTAARCAVASERYAVTVIEEREWHGRPGAPLHRAKNWPATSLQPLWVFELCRGIIAVETADQERAAGPDESVHAAVSDLTRVRCVVGHRVPLSTGSRNVDEVQRVPLKVWLNGAGFIRRIRAESGVISELTVELTDFGTPVPEGYWQTLASPLRP